MTRQKQQPVCRPIDFLELNQVNQFTSINAHLLKCPDNVRQTLGNSYFVSVSVNRKLLFGILSVLVPSHRVIAYSSCYSACAVLFFVHFDVDEVELWPFFLVDVLCAFAFSSCRSSLLVFRLIPPSLLSVSMLAQCIFLSTFDTVFLQIMTSNLSTKGLSRRRQLEVHK